MRRVFLIAAALLVALPWIFVPAPKVAAQITLPQCGGAATLSWTIPTQDTAGNPLISSNALTGFTAYVGTDGSTYPESVFIANPSISNYVWQGFCDGVYYFVVTASNSAGESAFSNQASKTVAGFPFSLGTEPTPPVLVVQ